MNNLPKQLLSVSGDIPSPCFILDEKKFLENLKILRTVADNSGATVLLALKGFALWHVFPHIRTYLDGIAASSLHEARLAFEEAGFKPHTYAPAYRENEVREILKLSSHITFNSYAQYLKYRDAAIQNNVQINLRINPEYSEVKTDLYNPCLPGSRLGITRENFPGSLPPDITGLHFHTLCEQGAITLKNTLAVIEKKFGDFLPQVSRINMGGGHLITARDYDRRLLTDLLRSFSDKYHVEVILEPGAAVAWDAGFLVSTVQDIVTSNGISTAILDVSFAAHMPDCLEMPYIPEVYGASGPPERGKPVYRLGGLTCLAGDFVGPYSFDKPLKSGDKIIFRDMMHYTMVKTNTFNGVNLPSIGLIRKNDHFDLIRSFGYEEYKGRLS